MMTSRSSEEVVASFTGRRDIHDRRSVSNTYLHISDAFGSSHDDEGDLKSGGRRPLSFLPGLSYEEGFQSQQIRRRQQNASDSPGCSTIDQPIQTTGECDGHKGGFRHSQNLHSTMGPQASPQERNPNSSSSPTPSLRGVQIDPSLSLTSIDNPNDIAQELSNLQALRRLSMDVGHSIDPDMPLMHIASIPSIAPRGDDDENDPSRLLWVPARVHPEIAPSEFKSFLESRLHLIRRRSGDSFPSPSDESSKFELGVASTSLRRKKSMLSRQISTSGGREVGGNRGGPEISEDQDSRRGTAFNLDDLVKDPTTIAQKLARESPNLTSGFESSGNDLPILPIAPGAGLRRSTRTTYRKGGSLRSGDKSSFSSRVAQRQHEDFFEQEKLPIADVARGPCSPSTNTESLSGSPSKPRRSVRRQQNFSQDSSILLGGMGNTSQIPSGSRPTAAEFHEAPSPAGTQLAQQIASSFESSRSEEAGDTRGLPNLSFSVERLLSDASGRGLDFIPDHSGEEHSPDQNPVRSSPYEESALNSQSLSKSTAHTWTLSFSGGEAVDADTLTPKPPLTDERKAEKKSRKDRDDEVLSHPSKSGSTWKWFKGGVDDKEKRKDESKKSKFRSSSERAQDNVRLDLLQTSIDNNATKARETIIPDRDNVDLKPQEDRKKESNRRNDLKKEKDGSIFSSIFGGGKKREDRERSKKNQHYLSVPEDPPYQPLKADVDYNWSRFPLLEERAIYRMAHIKLANPRRSLHSQVLLSNFMYSYLAIVQAMHPQMSVPISPQQKRIEEEARRKREEQQARQEHQYLVQNDSMAEQDSQQTYDQYDYDYHRVGSL